MEMCAGGEMFDLMRKGSLDEDKTAEIMKQAMYTLNYLHSHQIAHRDLKP
jgi:serine/threonine protein kinase